MPITPRFDLDQTETHVVVHIKVPHVRVSVSTVQVTITDGGNLHFSSPPYLLQLSFAESFDETATESCATYEPTIENGRIRLELLKEVPGMWKDLDLVGNLTARPPESTSKWLLGVEDERIQQMENDQQNEEGSLQRHTQGYGFARMFHDVYSDLTRDGLAKEMLELLESDDRRADRILLEDSKFCPDRYRGDLDAEDDYLYQCAMQAQPHWLPNVVKELEQLSLDHKETKFFMEDEQLQLSTIPYPILPKLPRHDRLVAGMVDILFAYAYDHLLTDGDPTVESAWTVATLSASLSCLDDWLDDVVDDESQLISLVVISSIRRVLVYPYLRNLEFACHVWHQVAQILENGIRCVIRCLLQTRQILERSELFYLGNKVWLDPYLAWVQKEPILLGTWVHEIKKFLTQDTSTVIPLLGLDLIFETNEESTDEESNEFSSASSDESGSEDDSKESNSLNSTDSANHDIRNKIDPIRKAKPSFLLDIV